ncbi:MAG: hypothetical protein M1837_006390 [Sclerophora amabilis]|nr:MAG: hypothetical protein M1837_006390 [Sclerophora amabilis]
MENAELQGTARDLDQGGLIAIAWVGLGLAGFFVTVRTGTRFYRAERLTPDDYWMLVAWAMLLVNAVLQTLQTPHLYYLAELGAGRVPADEIALVHGNAYVRYEFVIIALFWTVLWCVKASFLALFWRLFDGLPAKYRRTWWVVVAFVILAYIGCWLASALNCHPAGNYFNFGTPIISP